MNASKSKFSILLFVAKKKQHLVSLQNLVGFHAVHMLKVLICSAGPFQPGCSSSCLALWKTRLAPECNHLPAALILPLFVMVQLSSSLCLYC